MTGYATDGHKYIATALEKGAAAVLCQNLPEGDGPYIRHGRIPAVRWR